VQFGSFEIEQLSEGTFLASKSGVIDRYRPVFNDGADVLTAVGKKKYKLFGIDPLLIKTPHGNVLLDAGIGYALDRRNPDPGISNLPTALEVLNVDPASIKYVVLSHLHEDHAKGLTFTDSENITRPVVPNATIYVQRAEWEYAMQQFENPPEDHRYYNLDDLYSLVADGRFTFLEEQHKELLPGIEIIRTGGHTPGHQIVRLSEGGWVGYFLGDLQESPEYINSFMFREKEFDKVVALTQRSGWLKRAYDENALLFFYHGTTVKAARLKRGPGRMFLIDAVNV
jgi:glyoxylase-like metal-dependent hydrolase (beta-lactamase superfamily II)